MGPSGAGKTTLLNILSGRIQVEKGTVQVNDCVPLTAKTFSAHGAYVTQDNLLFEWFTVEEAIMFAASLKLNLGRDERAERVDEII